MKRAAIIAARFTTDTIDGAPTIQTPSRAEHGPEGVLLLDGRTQTNKKEITHEKQSRKNGS